MRLNNIVCSRARAEDPAAMRNGESQGSHDHEFCRNGGKVADGNQYRGRARSDCRRESAPCRSRHAQAAAQGIYRHYGSTEKGTIRGDMSFVGPRPERPYFVDLLKSKISYYDLRHYVKPGITGWAQVMYPYGASVEDAYHKAQYDLYYAKNISLRLDLLILLKTIKVVASRRGR